MKNILKNCPGNKYPFIFVENGWNFIAIKFEVTGVNFVACVSCQNGSGSLWLKLIGLSQTQPGIKALLSCNKQILDQKRGDLRERVFNWQDNDCLYRVEDKADPASSVPCHKCQECQHQHPTLASTDHLTCSNKLQQNYFELFSDPQPQRTAECVVYN